ncbi:MAG: hypothetical protein JST26_04575 [Bacteroidetes bacterium]|nr:hypothetical protein [Bacteroidota bacterium]
MQSIIKSYRASFIGLIFSASCFLLYYTFIVPLLIMLPLSLTLESILSGIFPYQDYSKTGQGVIICLAILFAILSAIYFIRIYLQLANTRSYKTTTVALYMTVMLFVVHPLVFYIDLSEDWSRAGDGQFMLSLGDTFQLSSPAFLIIGMLTDGLAIYKRRPGR